MGKSPLWWPPKCKKDKTCCNVQGQSTVCADYYGQDLSHKLTYYTLLWWLNGKNDTLANHKLSF